MKKKIKTYKFDKFGYAQLLLDIKKEKQDKVNNVVSTVILLGFLGLGLMSKEFLVLYLTGKGVSFVTDLFIG